MGSNSRLDVPRPIGTLASRSGSDRNREVRRPDAYAELMRRSLPAGSLALAWWPAPRQCWPAVRRRRRCRAGRSRAGAGADRQRRPGRGRRTARHEHLPPTPGGGHRRDADGCGRGWTRSCGRAARRTPRSRSGAPDGRAYAAAVTAKGRYSEPDAVAAVSAAGRRDVRRPAGQRPWTRSAEPRPAPAHPVRAPGRAQRGPRARPTRFRRRGIPGRAVTARSPAGRRRHAYSTRCHERSVRGTWWGGRRRRASGVGKVAVASLLRTVTAWRAVGVRPGAIASGPVTTAALAMTESATWWPRVWRSSRDCGRRPGRGRWYQSFALSTATVSAMDCGGRARSAEGGRGGRARFDDAAQRGQSVTRSSCGAGRGLEAQPGT